MPRRKITKPTKRNNNDAVTEVGKSRLDKQRSKALKATGAGKVAKAAKAAKAADGAKKRKHRWKPGTVVKRQIKQYQKSTELLLARGPFRRLVREIALGIRDDLKFQKGSVLALQEAAEAYLVKVFGLTNLLAEHAGRETILARDMKLARQIRGDDLGLQRGPY